MSVSVSPTLSPAPVLPVLLFFEQDEATRHLLGAVHRYRRLSVERLDRDLARGEWVVVCSSEKLLADNYNKVRQSNVRVIGIAERSFADARIDGVVYSYLPPHTPAALIERAVEN